MELEPKEKAKELVSRFLRLEDDTTFYWEPYYDKHYNDDEVMPHAKKCALLCVDEMQSVTMKTSKDECMKFVKYWREVKRELQAL